MAMSSAWLGRGVPLSGIWAGRQSTDLDVAAADTATTAGLHSGSFDVEIQINRLQGDSGMPKPPGL